MQFPDVFRSYQQHLAPTSNNYRKRSPAIFEDLVSQEMRKGCNMEVAAQRVAQAYGSTALSNRMFKRTYAVENQFRDAAEEIYRSENCSRTEALRKARQEKPTFYKALRSV